MIENPLFSRVWKLYQQSASLPTLAKTKDQSTSTTHNFCILFTANNCPFNLNILSSSMLEWSAICSGFVLGSLHGSDSTMISKSTNLSESDVMSFVKQKEYSPGELAVRM